MNSPKLLIYGYGDPTLSYGKITHELCARLEHWLRNSTWNDGKIEQNHHFHLEDIETICSYDIVIFVCGAKGEYFHYICSEVVPAHTLPISMEEIRPGEVLHLCSKFYSCCPKAFQVLIKDPVFPVPELEPQTTSLEQIFDFFKHLLWVVRDNWKPGNRSVFANF
ncbi:hypothetical protein AAG747_15965 [Rapidithrix thailandica]|uniref:Uncharacterized protein n=1 Tax=Rapidithrix thailandica TaxID=413964 RepID=A0AAW9RX46_9BACT